MAFLQREICKSLKRVSADANIHFENSSEISASLSKPETKTEENVSLFKILFIICIQKEKQESDKKAKEAQCCV